ncbi:PREDICTED: uncharacterized protein LOC108554033 [Eufriesea mexicana]|uniref:uncharacterized protein LOC108554033 n=1 Tax=Eufriesea mexicana TaxID=516756 RepID=UPI00083C888E|nr:PREDICTED: uncharacterized protein LOC108554033 [Eufriesea mexicana]
MNRSQRRMHVYNMKKADETGDWENMVTAEQRPQENPPAQRRPTARAAAWKAKRTAKPPALKDPAEDRARPVVRKAATETLKDEPMWAFGPFNGTQPKRQINQHNLDFSTFPLLCERVYMNLESVNPRLRKEMPFCMFQHVMVSALNAYLINHVRTVNAEDRFADEESPVNLFATDFVLPADIAEYLKNIANTVTPQGNLIRVNVPDACIPKPPMPAEGEIPCLASGTFGAVTAENHNAYECYVSPFITASLVTATKNQNVSKTFDAAWNPLPAGAFPTGTVPNENLLGYKKKVERLNPEGLQAIANPEFQEGDNMAGRLRISSQFNARVSGTLQRMKDQYKMVTGIPGHGSNSAALRWIKVSTIPGTSGNQNTTRLSSVMGAVNSPVALGSAQANIVGVFGLKRERTANARGLCYTLAEGPRHLVPISKSSRLLNLKPTSANEVKETSLSPHTDPRPDRTRVRELRSESLNFIARIVNIYISHTWENTPVEIKNDAHSPKRRHT